ncbi:hypothetical protein ALP93_200209 [Pseudomonas syringae pv. helianthi]|nr:hypothetical protein ALP93_200209 [Pseudomonas syringae pv. helianthi]
MVAPQVSLSPLRAAATLLMKTLVEPSAIFTGPGCLSQAPMLFSTCAALRLLMYTLGEAVRIVPEGEENILPMASPAAVSRLPPTPAASPARRATPNPHVKVAIATVAISAIPSTAPIRKPPRAPVCDISSPNRAASNISVTPDRWCRLEELQTGEAGSWPTSYPNLASARH